MMRHGRVSRTDHVRRISQASQRALLIDAVVARTMAAPVDNCCVDRPAWIEAFETVSVQFHPSFFYETMIGDGDPHDACHSNVSWIHFGMMFR